MLDIKAIREDKESVLKALNKRGKDFTKEIESLLGLDEKRREILAVTDMKKAQRNEYNKKIPALKQSGENIDALMQSLKKLSDEIKENDVKINEIELKQKEMLLRIPNALNSSVVSGKDETDNVEIRKFSEPRSFNFTPKPHWEIGKNLDILDSERAAKVTGARFHFYKGLGARLERAIINYYLDSHIKTGYVEIMPPFMVNSHSMTGTGQLPKFADDMFKIEDTDYYLIPTAEVPVTNLYKNEILKASDLPIKHCAYSACFRAEAGSAGRDTRGLIRQHQFNKVELVKFTTSESSYDELESLTNDAEQMLKNLNLPYRIVALCGGDIGFSSAKTYDIEVWLPSYERYAEISSCSNFEDFQARRASLKYRDESGKTKFMHTLNGSGLAVGRTVAAILENYQNEDGSVTVPLVLIPYMGCEIIK